MSVHVSTVSTKFCFSLTGRILEERRRHLSPENVEMLSCIKDWELGARREQHEALDTELQDAFERICTLMKKKQLVVFIFFCTTIFASSIINLLQFICIIYNQDIMHK